MNRRAFLMSIVATNIAARLSWAAASGRGDRLAAAARAQLGVTTGYDPAWTAISYPNGDVPRSTGVCADVVIRAARDGLGLDLQKLVHEDMEQHFAEYPARRTWGSRHTDTNIDHRRVLNLETYFKRSHNCIWHADGPVASDEFSMPLESGDIVTWLLDARLPHIGIVVDTSRSGRADRNSQCHVVHNIGRGTEESILADFHPHRAIGHYRWPSGS
jgi:uncharacterized protein YijF (DUF1287 family)